MTVISMILDMEYPEFSERFGKRWAWNDGTGRSQRETEDAIDFGPGNVSLDEELAAVVARWSGEAAPAGGSRPATLADGVRIAALCDEMYASLADASAP